MEDTIVAISTALAPAALAVVRLSGPNAVGVADRFVQLNGCRLPELPANRLIHGRVSDNGEFIDDVMICVMRAPRSYTGEDVVEISCHGSTLVARKILELSFKHGARLAEPGEFTKRAFLNGKMDLTQAEAVMDLISAKTQRARAAASRVLEGGLSHKLEAVRTALVEALAYVEAYIDFPDEDIGKEEIAFVIERLEHARTEIQKLLATAREGRILREGLRVAIIGRPNVGKSSLLNALTGTERAIVTPIPGTTRDILEESVSIRGIPIVLVDTAGVRKARGQVEKLGIERTRSAIASSDLILHVVDGSKPANK
ncbi:MAG: tRNA uridine-5-carboxymethylaminomethyl(34) synthesis GTPase MnmE, partial [Verrucomicrobiae bacterium]|nr:tRNA uridine-5-carboxymethylaminomethyl(34) synthesis GTPase MnmE [Verrucomicrobiae bacterium]